MTRQNTPLIDTALEPPSRPRRSARSKPAGRPTPTSTNSGTSILLDVHHAKAKRKQTSEVVEYNLADWTPPRRGRWRRSTRSKPQTVTISPQESTNNSRLQPVPQDDLYVPQDLDPIPTRVRKVNLKNSLLWW